VVECKAATESVGESFGTAVLVDDAGTFVTNAHVVTYKRLGETYPFDTFFVRFSTEDEYRAAELVKYSVEKDIAVLRLKEINGVRLRSVKIGNSQKLQAGETVYAVGNSQNYGISIAKGMVGIPLINIRYEERERAVIQCDITIAEGNSGGALLDSKGRLIGITTFRTKDHAGNVVYGIAYCIPWHIAEAYIKGEE
ncbi:MAG: serine protease, partial [Clostridiales bacterium]|nr:serine protease [Clostridiales bacterium]